METTRQPMEHQKNVLLTSVKILLTIWTSILSSEVLPNDPLILSARNGLKKLKRYLNSDQFRRLSQAQYHWECSKQLKHSWQKLRKWSVWICELPFLSLKHLCTGNGTSLGHLNTPANLSSILTGQSRDTSISGLEPPILVRQHGVRRSKPPTDALDGTQTPTDSKTNFSPTQRF